MAWKFYLGTMHALCIWHQIDLVDTDIDQIFSHPKQNCVVNGLCLERNFVAFSLLTSLHHIYIYEIYQNIYIYISEQFKDKTCKGR